MPPSVQRRATPSSSSGKGEMDNQNQQPLISICNVSKAFGQVQALVDVSLNLYPGEVVGLLGDNGAGKSTLIKILSGNYHADEGTFAYQGNPVTINHPADAQALGIATVYQDLALVETRSVAHNIYLGREPRRFGMILDRGKMERDATVMLDDLNIRLPSQKVDVELLSGGQRQAVALSRALAMGGNVLLLDEPTAALGVEQTQQVHNLINSMRRQDKAVVVITHDLSDILDITDRIAVLRQGQLWAYVPSSETTTNQIIGWITGVAPPHFQNEADQ